MTRVVSSILGLIGLVIALRGRLGGRYWRWRMTTVYGSTRPGLMTMARDAALFGAWRRRMARIGSSGGVRPGA
ncbi:MAG: hypothetical protein DHS20C14_01200 [Phycisphaeraceae bacterium]|nr:MAG: hypothetical protein DHS20C14_01200 [Phycisphaeraceae bacterium]